MKSSKSKQTIVKVLAIIGGLAILAMAVGVLFPVFARSRAKAQQTAGLPPPRASDWEAATETGYAPEESPRGPLFGSPAEAAVEQQIVYTADYRVEVDDAQAAARQVESLAKQAGGFLSDLSKHVDDVGNWTVTVTIRVPAEKFTEALEKIEALGKVKRGEVQREEVTRQYIDLQARLRNAQREEERLAALMKRSAKLADIVMVEEKLSSVQERIERLKGELSYLQERVALSTIAASLTEERLAQVEAPGPFHIFYYLRGAWRALVFLVRAIVVIVVYGVIVGWIIWLPLLARHLIRRRRRQRMPVPPAPPQE